jgi:hypothetical protein
MRPSVPHAKRSNAKNPKKDDHLFSMGHLIRLYGTEQYLGTFPRSLAFSGLFLYDCVPAYHGKTKITALAAIEQESMLPIIT